MKLSFFSLLGLGLVYILTFAGSSCSDKQKDSVEPEAESAPTGSIYVEPYCEDVLADLGLFTSRSTSYGYIFNINFKYEYKKYPYSYIYLILPDGKSFLPIKVVGQGEKRAVMGFSQIWYSCCAASPPQVFKPIYDVRDMGQFDTEPRQTGYHYPTSGDYKLMMIFKETEDFDNGAFLSTKIIDLPNSLRNYPCVVENSKARPIVEPFDVNF